MYLHLVVNELWWWVIFVVNKLPGLMILYIGLSCSYDNGIGVWWTLGLIVPWDLFLLWWFYFVVGKPLGLLAL